MVVSIVAVVWFLLDQWSKQVVLLSFTLGESVAVIPDVFHFTFILNRGAAFGILENQRWFFLLIVVALLGLVFWQKKYVRSMPRYAQLALGLLLGGALGNGFDRYRLGAVVDFFDLRVWPIFNVADIGICVGVALLALFFWRVKE